jgi:acetyl-CoA synthetase
MSVTHAEAPSSYPPPPEFAENANATAELYREAEEDRLAFWAKQADRLSWQTPFTEVLDWSQAPFAKWFVGGKLNVAYNCVDRHVEAGNGDRVAIHWEGEPVGESRSLTYSDLLAEVSRAANALTDLGVVATGSIYMPMVPGRSWRSGVRGSVRCIPWCSPATRPPRCGRIDDAQAKLVITTDGQYRRGKAVAEEAVDEAVRGQDSIESVWW